MNSATQPMLYLDCYSYAALGGEFAPVNSFGPAVVNDVLKLKSKIEHHFDRVEIVEETKGCNPRSFDRWYS